MTPRWRVRPTLPVVKFGGAALLLGLGTFLAANDNDPVQLGIAVLAAAGLLLWGIRDLAAPVRLAVDPAGITVISGYAGRRHLPWTEIERIRVDTRTRLGLRTETLEIDTGESLHLLGRNDLGTEPAEVADVLHRFRATYSTGVTGEPPR
ncbi:PH domain-containing protein [Plantactinospora sonchi]|uniref:PH domain-containing protein n=1 Tax=Plantactinospora sonchi TaxID=1544735 RepID=A0ABU7RQ43_9ACTN